MRNVFVTVTTCILSIVMILSFIPFNSDGNDDTENTNIEGTDTKSIKCPDFANMSVENILSHQYYKNGFLKFNFEYVESTEYDINHVCDQSVEPDKIVEKGSEITLYISTGQNKIKIPNVYNMTEVNAVGMLEAVGFKTKIQKIASNDVQAGKVIFTNPAIGTTIANDTVVTIYVSSGAPVSQDSDNNTSFENTSTDTTPAYPLVPFN